MQLKDDFDFLFEVVVKLPILGIHGLPSTRLFRCAFTVWQTDPPAIGVRLFVVLR